MPVWLSELLSDPIGTFFGGLLRLFIALFMAIFSGIGCLFEIGSACTRLEESGVLFLYAAPRTFVPIGVMFGALYVFRILRYGAMNISALPRAVVSIPGLVGKAVAWLHYFFVPHPGESAIKAARKYRIPGKIDTKAVASAMKRDLEADLDPHAARQPAYKSENQRKRAEEAQKLAEADRKLFEELEARERARRRMERAKRGEE